MTIPLFHLCEALQSPKQSIKDANYKASLIVANNTHSSTVIARKSVRTDEAIHLLNINKNKTAESHSKINNDTEIKTIFKLSKMDCHDSAIAESRNDDSTISSLRGFTKPKAIYLL